MGNAKNVIFKDVKEMLETIKYTEVKETARGFYSAISPFGEVREFTTLETGNDVRLISRRDLIKEMKKQKDFQTFEVSFTSDDGIYQIVIDDYVIGHDVEAYLKSLMNNIEEAEKVELEKMDMFYN